MVTFQEEKQDIEPKNAFSILLVDDDPVNLIGVSRNLEFEGFCVTTADCGESALEILELRPFDLIITDLVMNKVNGIDVLKSAKKRYPDTMVIILTGRGSIANAIDALRLDADDYLLKPCESEEMIFRINRCFEKKRIADEKKSMEHALKESEERFRHLLENSQMGIAIALSDSLLYSNSEYGRTFQLSENSPIDNFLELIHPGDRETFDNLYQSLITGQIPSMETNVRFFAGEDMERSCVKWAHIRGRLISYSGMEATLLNTMDITDAKELEHLIKMEDKMSSLGRISAGMAHEIRNPLSGINVFLNAIKENFEDPDNSEEIKDILAQTQKAANRIESVLKRVLDFSKPGMPNKMPVSINDSIHAAIGLSHGVFSGSKIKLKTRLEKNLPRVDAEPQLLEQVLLNMLSNSVDAMDRDQPGNIIEITSEHKDEQVNIHIMDSGIGIQPENREKIFDPFFSTKSEGSGIGLSICHRIISDHQGSIRVDQSKYGGTEFTISIPACLHSEKHS